METHDIILCFLVIFAPVVFALIGFIFIKLIRLKDGKYNKNPFVTQTLPKKFDNSTFNKSHNEVYSFEKQDKRNYANDSNNMMGISTGQVIGVGGAISLTGVYHYIMHTGLCTRSTGPH